MAKFGRRHDGYADGFLYADGKSVYAEAVLCRGRHAKGCRRRRLCRRGRPTGLRSDFAFLAEIASCNAWLEFNELIGESLLSLFWEHIQH